MLRKYNCSLDVVKFPFRHVQSIEPTGNELRSKLYGVALLPVGKLSYQQGELQIQIQDGVDIDYDVSHSAVLKPVSLQPTIEASNQPTKVFPKTSASSVR